jgi:hypothetical protein
MFKLLILNNESRLTLGIIPAFSLSKTGRKPLDPNELDFLASPNTESFAGHESQDRGCRDLVGARRVKNRARKRRRGKIKPYPNAEMLTIAECAKKMRCSPETARNRLRDEAGVISTGRAETRKGLRKYDPLLVPRSVLERWSNRRRK